MLRRASLLLITTLLLAASLHHFEVKLYNFLYTKPYEAPFHACGEGTPMEAITLNGYKINLFPGHTREQHSADIGKDITPHVHHIYDSIEENIVYVGWDINKELLGKIRADRGVEAVECDSMPWVD
jgi:hypothetical protein